MNRQYSRNEGAAMNESIGGFGKLLSTAGVLVVSLVALAATPGVATGSIMSICIKHNINRIFTGF